MLRKIPHPLLGPIFKSRLPCSNQSGGAQNGGALESSIVVEKYQKADHLSLEFSLSLSKRAFQVGIMIVASCDALLSQEQGKITVLLAQMQGWRATCPVLTGRMATIGLQMHCDRINSAAAAVASLSVGA